MCCPHFDHSPPGSARDNSAFSHENYYVVQAGDTLYAISKFYNVSLDELIEANPDIEPDLMEPGRKISIPMSMPAANCSGGEADYIVRKGDTFYSIGKKFKIRLTALLKANPNINPDALLIGQSICIPIISGTYVNYTYGVRLMYPYRWSRVDDDRYEGVDGFFQIAAISSDEPLDGVCRNEAYHKLKPYGTRPEIDNLIAGNHEACCIIPSSDQPMEMRNQAALIMKYHKPIEIESVSYEYLIIWTDRKHLKDIYDSLEFINE